MKIPFAQPWITNNEKKRVQGVLNSRWLAQGKEVQNFEKEFSNYVGSKYACAVSSCTAALHLALKSLGVGVGDEVITVSHSYISTANSIKYCRARPVFVDINKTTFNIDPDLIEKSITKKTKAILCVHQMGMPCDLKKIKNIAKKYKLYVVEDCACALGSEIQINKKMFKIGKPIGDIACFSFHPRKIITTGEGGMLTTNNKKLYDKFILWRQHSMNFSTFERHSSNQIIFEQYKDVGFNYRITDVQASIGRSQLSRVEMIIKKRRNIAKFYNQNLKDNKYITIPLEPSWCKSNFQSYCINISPKFKQKEVMLKLLKKGISTRRGIMCAHLEPAYKSESKFYKRRELIKSKSARNHSILLPMYYELTKNQQSYIISTLKNIIKY